jgi:hypothetical protein
LAWWLVLRWSLQEDCEEARVSPSWSLWSGCGACHLQSGGKAAYYVINLHGKSTNVCFIYLGAAENNFIGPGPQIHPVDQLKQLTRVICGSSDLKIDIQIMYCISFLSSPCVICWSWSTRINLRTRSDRIIFPRQRLQGGISGGPSAPTAWTYGRPAVCIFIIILFLK